MKLCLSASGTVATFNKKAAFSFIMVLPMTFFLSIILLGCWHQTSLLLDLVLEREAYYKRLYINEIILNYGINFAKEDFGSIDVNKNYEIDPKPLINFILSNDKKNAFFYHDLIGKIILKKREKEDSVLVIATLKNKTSKEIINKLSCLVSKLEKRNDQRGFKSDTVLQKKTLFTIKNFTVGSLF